tara:strand:- start:1817 stop:3280 length:1464 start_codon:yes stop_codon:yes gene_type:complete
MIVQVTKNKSVSNKFLKDNTNVIFLDESVSFKDLTVSLNDQQKNFIKNKIKNRKKGSKFLLFDLNTNIQLSIIIIVKNVTTLEIQKLGAEFLLFLENNNCSKITIFNTNKHIKKFNLIEHLIHGLKLKSYTFDIYKSKNEQKKISINLVTNTNKEDIKIKKKLDSLLDGINFTKDLVSEPGNVLHPDEYSKRLLKLKKIGLKVTVYDKKKLKKLGCNALLGVGQGSIRGSYLVVLEWKGKKNKSKPLAFVGKGVCFDTGGISLKPAKFMEDMTYDMAGSAVVVGLMKNFALRKAKINAVGVVGLVENMPGGNAQRPGDIIKSYSGKTIEVLNTDAEGRLVLADAITFTEKKYKPSFIIDLATLTGAIIVSLGSEYAGLFSNNDKISKEIYDAGLKVDEKVWRMPLHKNYDKLINSKNADMQNINYVGGAGSTTAAQFLQRFILNKTPWAHLDIAGMAFSKYGGALNSSGATGYGVRLLNKFVEDNYE